MGSIDAACMVDLVEKMISDVSALKLSLLTLESLTAALRCYPRTVHHLFEVSTSQLRMQNRVKFQTDRKAQQECGDGKGDSAA